MFRRWVRLLPLFVVVWLSKRYNEKLNVMGETMTQTFTDVLIRVDATWDKQPPKERQ